MISKLTEFRQRLHPGAFLWIAPFLLVLIQKALVAESLYQHPKEVVIGMLQALFFGILNFLNWIHSKSNKKALYFSIAISFFYFLTKTHDPTFDDFFPVATLIWVLIANLYASMTKRLSIGFCLLIVLIVFVIMQPQQESQEFQLVLVITGVSIISQVAVNRLIKPSFVFRRISIFLGLNGITYICAGALTSLTQYLTIGLALIFTAISAK
jgi:hypothetical protein